MANADRAARMARIERMERIKALEAAKTEAPVEAPAPLTVKPPVKGREVQAALQGAGQGFSMGYMPQLQAASEKGIEQVGSMKDKLAQLVGAKSLMSTDAQLEADGFQLPKAQSYTQKRDQYIKRDEELAKENPWSYGLGQVGGTIATSMALPGGTAMKTASKARKLLTAGAAGGAIGLMQNPGDVEGEVSPVQLKDRLFNMGTGIPTGMLPVAVIEDLAPRLKKMAGSEAFKALGPYARAARKAMERGQAENIGNTLLDEGVVGGLPKSYGKIQKGAQELAAHRGGELEQYVGALDEKAKGILPQQKPALVPAGTKVPLDGSIGVNRKAIADSLRTDLLTAAEHTDIPTAKATNKQIEGLIQQFENGDDAMIPVLKAWIKKKEVGKLVNWDRLKGQDIPTDEVVNRGLYGKLNKGIEDAADFVESQPNSNLLPGTSDKTLKGKFRELNKIVHHAKEADKIAGTRTSHELAKQLTLPVVGATFGMGHGENFEERLQNAMAMGAGGYLLRKGMQFKPQVAAQVFRGAGKLAEKGSKITNPWVLPALANELTRGD